MLQSANLISASRDRTIERRHSGPITFGRLLGSVLLALIYAVTIYASKGLFDSSTTDASRVVAVPLGILNVVILPLLILGMVAGIRRIWLDGVANPRLARILRLPLWIAFILALLTVPLWMGMENARQYASTSATQSYSATLLLAPWGFLLAYGLALLITGAMFDFTYPVSVGADTQPDTAGRE